MHDAHRAEEIAAVPGFGGAMAEKLREFLAARREPAAPPS